MSKNIIPITDLRNTTEISKMCHEVNEPIYVTKNGYGDLVIMSTETLEIYETKLRDLEEAVRILQSELEYAKTGVAHNARDLLPKLKEEAFNEVYGANSRSSK